jgi:hypothetical protein
VSAAETFTQALMRRRPKIVRVGENTQGVFSDVLGRRLPNGMAARLTRPVFPAPGALAGGPRPRICPDRDNFTCAGFTLCLQPHDASAWGPAPLISPGDTDDRDPP